MTAPGCGSWFVSWRFRRRGSLDDSLFGGEAELTAGQAAMVALSSEQKQRKCPLALVTLKVT